MMNEANKYTITTIDEAGYIVISMANRAGRTWIYNQKCWEYPHEAYPVINGINLKLANGEKLDPLEWDNAPVKEAA